MTDMLSDSPLVLGRVQKVLKNPEPNELVRVVQYKIQSGAAIDHKVKLELDRVMSALKVAVRKYTGKKSFQFSIRVPRSQVNRLSSLLKEKLPEYEVMLSPHEAKLDRLTSCTPCCAVKECTNFGHNSRSCVAGTAACIWNCLFFPIQIVTGGYLSCCCAKSTSENDEFCDRTCGSSLSYPWMATKCYELMSCCTREITIRTR
jgi:hypothetical protein